MTRCAYVNGPVRCAKPARKGDYCKAHAPRVAKILTARCEACGGSGWVAEGIDSWRCQSCRGTGRQDVPAVLVPQERAR